MSSDFHLICLSHNPAIRLDISWHSGANGRIVAEHEMMNPAASAHEEVRRHAQCDLIIGEYSYPLVEIGYKSYEESTEVEWIDVRWVRLLALTAQSRPHSPEDNYKLLPDGWTWGSAWRLLGELGLTDG